MTAPTTPTLTADLRRISAFADLSEDQLGWLAAHMDEIRLQPGETSIVEGDAADRMLVILEGEVQARREKGPMDGRVYIARAGDVTGMLPFSRMATYGVTGRAVVPTRIARLPAALFPEMLDRIPELEERLVGILSDRIRETTRVEQQLEKLSALGTLSAGLAHELNNPAAAARRSSGALKERLFELRCLTANLLERGLAREAAHASCDLREKAVERAGESVPDPLTASEQEDELTAWLEGRKVPRAWALAGTFASSRLTVADLEDVEGQIPPEALGDVLAWAESGLAADTLADEVESAVRRISELVAAVKSYSHMDSSAQTRGEVDLAREIDSTVAVLTHKIREKNATVIKDYAPDLPRVSAFAAELNQVWTQLLDNALDAVAPGGHVTIRTFRENSHAIVEIRDDGPGIPSGIQGRIWEPFFTTKPTGEGAGLGLDIARRIVIRRHGGEIAVKSVPGDTRFTVRLPV
jgi:signal transduction histidine kinase